MKLNNDHLIFRAAKGAAAGLAGTVLLQGLRTASQHMLPKTMPPIQEDPGQFMVVRAERSLPQSVGYQIPAVAEKALAKILAVGYGVGFGMLFGLLRPRRLSGLLSGALLGLGVWSLGYLGWLPLTGLMRSVRKQSPAQIVGPIVRHLGYGIVTSQVSNWFLNDDDGRK